MTQPPSTPAHADAYSAQTSACMQGTPPRATPGATPGATTAATTAATAAIVHSSALFQGQRTISIAHNGAVYRLQATRQGKLILTK